MAKFYNISLAEMSSFLEGQGFVRLALAGVYELVWARIARPGISMRVYTGITHNGDSRDKGTDAIRVCLFWRDGGKIVRIGSSIRVHRVEGWRGNLQARIDGWTKLLGPSCPLPYLQGNGQRLRVKFSE